MRFLANNNEILNQIHSSIRLAMDVHLMVDDPAVSLEDGRVRLWYLNTGFSRLS